MISKSILSKSDDLIQIKYMLGLPDSNFSSFYREQKVFPAFLLFIMMDLIWQVMPVLQQRAGILQRGACFPERCQMCSVLLPSCDVSVKVIFNFDI